MSEHQEKLEQIMECVNRETAGIDVNDRAMILLLLQEFIKCAIELDILDTLRPKKREVVRCRDCKHYDPHLTKRGVCFLPDGDGDFARWGVEPDGYCAWGERKEKEAVEVWQPASEYDVTCYETGDCDE